MKKNITEQAATVPMTDKDKLPATVSMTDKDKLLKVNSFGCFPKWLKNGSIGNYEGKKVFHGKNDKDQTVVFFADFKAKNIVTNKTASWSCPQLEETVGKTPEQSSFTPDQQSYINDLIKSEGVVQRKPSDYETEKGKWEVIDLNTRNSKLFPEPGKYLVYKQRSEINVTSPQQENIISGLTTQGYVKEQPPANKSDLYIKVNLQTIENGKYKDSFPTPFYMYQPIQNVNISELLKDRQTKFNDQKVDKKQCRQTIDILHTAYVKKYKLEDGERIALKTYAQRCSDQVQYIFGAQKKLETLMNLDPKDPSKLSLKLKNEESDNLKSLVRESLIEVSKNKKRMLTEEKSIVNTRLNLLTENVNVRSKKSREKFCDDLLNEMIYLNRQGFSQEVISEGFFDIIKGLFGNTGESISQMFKQKMIEWLLDKFGPEGFKNTWVGGIIVNTLSNTPIIEIPKLMECGYLTKALSKGIVEELPKQLQHKTGTEGAFYDILRNSMIETIEDSNLGQKIESKLVDIICPLLSGVKSKMDDVGSAMKDKALATS